MKFRAIGIDMALANMGLVAVDIDGDEVLCRNLKLVSTENQKGKAVRASSDDLRRATELHMAMEEYVEEYGASIAFAEVPSGSQSATAARALGIAVGVLACCPIPIIQVAPMEVKRLVNGNPKAKVSKAEVIAWARTRWPKANWLTHKVKGQIVYNNDNEHLADALATIVAGMATPQFQQLRQLHATSRTHNQRSAPGRIRLD